MCLLVFLVAFFFPAPLPRAQQPIPSGNLRTFVPHSATGGGYLTRVFITNLTGNANQLTINRIRQSGTLVSSVTTTLQPAATLTIIDSESERTQPIRFEWFAIASQMPIAASVVFDFEGQSVGLSPDIRQAVGTLATPTSSAFTAPVRFDPTTFATISMALANPNSASTTINMKLVDQNGTVVAQDSLTLTGFNQTAFDLSTRPAFQGFFSGGFLGSLAVAVTDPSKPVSAIMLGGLSTQLFSLPVVVGVAVPIEVTVNMIGLQFDPRDITVPRGSSITWINRDNVAHTATSDSSGIFDTGVLGTSGQFTITFNTDATIPYHCIFHGQSGGIGMAGRVIVGSGSSPGPSPQPEPDPYIRK
ncbi:MAG: hypothetical protein HY656_00840 [Acidobacteria bacterium]|nr:hypothetical protein [Acidobacteriota bacterium]